MTDRALERNVSANDRIAEAIGDLALTHSFSEAILERTIRCSRDRVGWCPLQFSLHEDVYPRAAHWRIVAELFIALSFALKK